MNRVEVLSAALQDRRAELEQAQGKLAQHEALLEKARADLAASNGDFATWESIDARVRFEQRQVARYTEAVEQCRGNVECASKALDAAKREAAIEELQGLEVEQRKQDSATLAKAAALYQEACALLASVQPSVKLAEERASELYRLGVTHERRHPVHSLWLALMNANPGKGPAYWNDAARFEHDLAANIQNVMALVEMPERQIAGLRQGFGDTSAVVPPAPKHEPAKTVTGASFTSKRYFEHLHAYDVRVEQTDAGEMYTLLLPSEFDRLGASIVSTRDVTLDYGLKARMVRFDDGREVLVAPEDPSIAERVGSAASSVLSMLGL